MGFNLNLPHYPLIPAKAGSQMEQAPHLDFYVYILASDRNGTLYTGHTDDLARRIWLHREKVHPGFTAKYGVTAFQHERRIKKWNRAWKLRMIEALNPDWNDLYERLNG